MTAFYVGQRVKLVRPINPKDAGMTGVIESIGEVKKDSIIKLEVTSFGLRGWQATAPGDCLVLWDGEYAPNPQDLHQLEPLQPPKSQIHEILAMKDLPNRDCKIARVGECANA